MLRYFNQYEHADNVLRQPHGIVSHIHMYALLQRRAGNVQLTRETRLGSRDDEIYVESNGSK